MCFWTWRLSCMCCTTDLLSPHEEEEIWLLMLVFLWVLLLRVLLKAGPCVCVTSSVNALCMLCLWDASLVLLLIEPANRKAIAATLSLGGRHHPAPWVRCSRQEKFLGPEEMPAPYMTSLKFLFLAVWRGDLLLLFFQHLLFIFTVSSMQEIKSSVRMMKNYEIY